MCELAVARRLQVRSYLPCPRFSTLVRYGCLLAQLIELDHIRSPGTPRVVLSLHHHRGQSDFELELRNWLGD
jgi:hypothetical protein